MIDHGSANGRSLKLTTGHLVDVMVRNAGNPHLLHKRKRILHDLAALYRAQLKCRIDNIINHRKVLQKTGLLEYEAHSLQPQLLDLLGRQLLHIHTVKIHLSGRRLIHCADAV